MLLARFPRLVFAVILTGLTACDNVTWGGVELRLERPPATEPVAADADPDAEAPPPPPPLDVGPALFMVEQRESGARILPVALLEAEGPTSFPDGEVENFWERFRDERMNPGRRFVLFSAGTRVGMFHADSAAAGRADPSAVPVPAREGAAAAEALLCTPRPTVPGWVEVVPDAAVRQRLLAVPAEAAGERERTEFVARSHTQGQRTTALNMASALYVLRGIRWPPSVLGARADMQVIGLPGLEREAIVSTFLYGDELGVGPAPPNAYSLFFIGEPQLGGNYDGYGFAYVRYREVGPDGKSVPLFVDHFDWDGDSRQEALLEIFGESGRSFATIERTEEGWIDTWEEPCEAPGEGSTEGAPGAP